MEMGRSSIPTVTIIVLTEHGTTEVRINIMAAANVDGLP